MINRLVHTQVVNVFRVTNIFIRNKKINFLLFLEPLISVAPINKSEEIPRTYTLKRTDSYDGLGIAISASTQSRSNHFIREVEQGSPGHRVGLRKNDRIISVNGVNVENVDFSNVLILIKQGLDNDNLQLSVIHEPEYN
jgi:predicted metalloprotease with PDZ domain